MQAGATVAVLGCGVDVAYPRENARLLAEIAEKGAVISEYAPGTAPLAAFSLRETASSAALRTVQSSSRRQSGAAL